MALKKRESYDPMAIEAAEDTFFKENGDDLAEVDRTEGFNASRDILDRLIKEGADDKDLVTSIAVCANQRELFTFLKKTREGTPRWTRFVETVLLLPYEVWEKGNGDLSEEIVPQLMNADLLGRIAKPRNDAHRKMRDNLTSTNHPLYCVVDFSPYWKERTEHFIERGDFWRAWDMIRKAHRGFFIADREEEAREARNVEQYRSDPANRCCHASVDLLRHLVSQLFEAMIKHGDIEPLAANDYVAPVDSYPKRVWEGPKGRKQKRTTIVENSYPCKALVLAVGGTYTETRRGGHRVRGPIRNRKAVDRKFHELSAEAYRIARHFQRGEMTGRASGRKTA